MLYTIPHLEMIETNERKKEIEMTASNTVCNKTCLTVVFRVQFFFGVCASVCVYTHDEIIEFTARLVKTHAELTGFYCSTIKKRRRKKETKNAQKCKT